MADNEAVFERVLKWVGNAICPIRLGRPRLLEASFRSDLASTCPSPAMGPRWLVAISFGSFFILIQHEPHSLGHFDHYTLIVPNARMQSIPHRGAWVRLGPRTEG